jgi:hypothetical protein
VVILLNTHVIGQTYTLDRDMDNGKFKCPDCSHTTTTIRSIKKHCRDHISNSADKRVASRYHPYTNGQPTHSTKDTDIVDTLNAGENEDDMDVDSELFNLIFL